MKTYFEICTGFGLVASTENFGLDHKVLLLLRAFFYVFIGKKILIEAVALKKLLNIR